AATLLPWALYEAYGDAEVLRRQLPSMRAWVDWAASRLDAVGVWRGDFHLGDWLDPGAPPDKPEQATTDRDFIASSYLSFSAGKLAQALHALGDTAAAADYENLGRRVARATWDHWRDAALTTQTGCAVVIVFGIAPADDVELAGERLAQLVHQAGGRVATGFLGTPLVLPALTRAGQIEAAYQLLLNRDAPGWLYQVVHGATTTWERWDAIRADGTIHTGDMAAADAASMTSFNHYAYGSVVEWFYRSLAGIAPGEPGYRRIDFAPQPGGGLAWAEAAIETPYGPASIRWDLDPGRLVVGLRVPPGATARFHPPRGWSIPVGVSPELGSGSHRLELGREPGEP
ncbi:MAG: alpha-L-rhamnosidase C-terminal domain-containing protein, partial [Novosphingobium sp.]